MGTPTILMSSPFWLYWAQIAVENEHAAFMARAGADRSNPGDAMVSETKASMISLTACAHAVDALYGAVANQVPHEDRETWRRNRTSRQRIILETLKRVYKVKVDDWREDADWLFNERRDSAIHHVSESRPVVRHPFYDTSSAQEMADYAAEACTRAVMFTLQVLVHCIGSQSDIRMRQVESVIELRKRPKG
jgi:hypothetical protein